MGKGKSRARANVSASTASTSKADMATLKTLKVPSSRDTSTFKFSSNGSRSLAATKRKMASPVHHNCPVVASGQGSSSPSSNVSSVTTSPPLTPPSAAWTKNRTGNVSSNTDGLSSTELGSEYPPLLEAVLRRNHRPSQNKEMPDPPRIPSFVPKMSLQDPVIVGKVYWMPMRNHSTGSLIFKQARETGFYDHPCLVTKVDGDIAFFYPMTSQHNEFRENTKLTLAIGDSSKDAGPNIMRLLSKSGCMLKETRVKVEQRYHCRLEELDYWSFEVQIDPTDLSKIDRRIAELESHSISHQLRSASAGHKHRRGARHRTHAI